MDIDPFTMQHKSHKNIFGLGQCTNIHSHGTSSTFLGILAQAEVVSNNTWKLLTGAEGGLSNYDGWNASPILVDTHNSIVGEWK